MAARAAGEIAAAPGAAAKSDAGPAQRIQAGGFAG